MRVIMSGKMRKVRVYPHMGQVGRGMRVKSVEVCVRAFMSDKMRKVRVQQLTVWGESV